MAMSRLVGLFALSLLLFNIWVSLAMAATGSENSLDAVSHPYGSTGGSLKPADCGPRCTGRCSATQHKKPCMFFCQKCCAQCLCVPAGTFGNKDSCPCYNNWKTKSGGPKCP